MMYFSATKSTQTQLSLLAAPGALTIPLPVALTHSSDSDANAKSLAKLHDDWSKAAATRDAIVWHRFMARMRSPIRLPGCHTPLRVLPVSKQKLAWLLVGGLNIAVHSLASPFAEIEPYRHSRFLLANRRTVNTNPMW
jgi:hypothetical protein